MSPTPLPSASLHTAPRARFDSVPLPRDTSLHRVTNHPTIIHPSRHASPHHGSPRHASPRSPRHASPRSPRHGRWGPPPDSLEGDGPFCDRDYEYEQHHDPPAYEQSLSQGNPHPHSQPHPRSPRTARQGPPLHPRRMPNGYRSSSPSPHRRSPHPGPQRPPHGRGPRKGLHEQYSETDEDDWC